MFTGYELTEESRNLLIKKFPPTYPNFIGRHITEKYGGVTKNTPVPKMPKDCTVVGYINENQVEGFLVEINGDVNRPDGSKYHITWSLGEGRKPVDTNKYVDDAVILANPIDIEVIPKNFSY